MMDKNFLYVGFLLLLFAISLLGIYYNQRVFFGWVFLFGICFLIYFSLRESLNTTNLLDGSTSEQEILTRLFF